MTDKLENMGKVIEDYRQKASNYDRTLKFFDIFSRVGFDISGWLKKAISELNLKNGDTVVDIGCGTGVSLPFLHQAVGSGGKIIGVDLSKEMLSHAQQLVTANQWTNVELVCADAAKFEFPPKVDAILSAYTLVLVPDCERVIFNACKAIVPGGRLVVLDMAWPKYFPLWWRHILFFLRAYGVTYDVLRRRSWETVQETMANQLNDFTLKRFWFGFFYLAYGTVGESKKVKTNSPFFEQGGFQFKLKGDAALSLLSVAHHRLTANKRLRYASPNLPSATSFIRRTLGDIGLLKPRTYEVNSDE